MFICMPKIKFIQFFLEIFHCKEFCNLIRLTAFWAITREPELCQIWDWWWNINNNIIFHFRLFLRKTNDRIFLMIKYYFGVILGRFCQNLRKNKVSWKKRSSELLQFPTIVPKIRKSQFLRRMLNWCTERQTDRQRWIYKTLRRTSVQLLK